MYQNKPISLLHVTPFGSGMSTRAIGGYRYSFNGKETDSETGLQDYGFRIYNPSLGKFLSVDPLADEYPYYTPYQFAGDMPIWAIDLDGLEPAAANFSFSNSSNSICQLPAYMNLPLCSNSSKDNTANNTPRLNNQSINAQEVFIKQKKQFDQAYNNAAGSVEYTNVSKKTNNYSDNCVVNTPRYEINDTRNLGGGINFLLDNKRPFYTGPLPEAPPKLASLVPFVGTKMQNDFNDQLRSLDINAPANSGYLGDFLAVIPITKIAGLGFAGKQVPAKLAAGWQGKGAYTGVDNWRNITLSDGKYIVGGLPEQSNYYTTLSGLNRSGLNKSSLFEGLQVAKHPQYGYRGQVGIYKVTGNTPAAFGTTYANPQFGSGGLPQIFIPNYSGLQLIKTIPLK
jgi:RHS repeat-associated protein